MSKVKKSGLADDEFLRSLGINPERAQRIAQIANMPFSAEDEPDEQEAEAVTGSLPLSAKISKVKIKD